MGYDNILRRPRLARHDPHPKCWGRDPKIPRIDAYVISCGRTHDPTV